MTQAPEPRSESTAVATDRSGAGSAGWERPSLLTQAAAAVGIVAGVVFIVGVVFFAGFFLGSRSVHHYSGPPPVMRCEMGGPGGMMGPGGTTGTGGTTGPGQPPSSTTPAPGVPSTPRP